MALCSTSAKLVSMYEQECKNLLVDCRATYVIIVNTGLFICNAIDHLLFSSEHNTDLGVGKT
jgi:hypothetical protein